METEFLLSEKSIIPPKGYIRVCNCIYYLTHPLGEISLSQDEILTIFDSCYSFTSEIDDSEVHKIFKEVSETARESIRESIWKPRGIHHTFLVVDGLCKQRCLFKDYDSSFKAKPEDYELAKQLNSKEKEE